MECTVLLPGVDVYYYVSEWEVGLLRNSMRALFTTFTFSFPVTLLSWRSLSRLHFFSFNVSTAENPWRPCLPSCILLDFIAENFTTTGKKSYIYRGRAVWNDVPINQSNLLGERGCSQLSMFINEGIVSAWQEMFWAIIIFFSPSSSCMFWAWNTSTSRCLCLFRGMEWPLNMSLITV